MKDEIQFLKNGNSWYLAEVPNSIVKQSTTRKFIDFNKEAKFIYDSFGFQVVFE